MHVHTHSHRPLIGTETDTNPLHHPQHTANMLAHPLALHSHTQAHTNTHLTLILVLLLNSHRRRHIHIHPQTRHLHLRYTHHTRTAHKHHTHTAHKHRLPDPPSQCISRCSSPLGAPPSPAGTGLSSGARTPSRPVRTSCCQISSRVFEGGPYLQHSYSRDLGSEIRTIGGEIIKKFK